MTFLYLCGDSTFPTEFAPQALPTRFLSAMHENAYALGYSDQGRGAARPGRPAEYRILGDGQLENREAIPVAGRSGGQHPGRSGDIAVAASAPGLSSEPITIKAISKTRER
jgi:hypothetical protein